MKSDAKQPLNRLLKRADFLSIAGQNRKWVAAGLILQVSGAPPDEKSRMRYGLTASGKIGNAVKRNRARRRLRALASDILPAHAASGHDYVLIARATTGDRPFDALRQDLITALQKLKVWHD